MLLAMWSANRPGARRASVWLLLGAGLWAAFFMQGLHATSAGVLTALFVPARVKIVPGALPAFGLFNAGVVNEATVLHALPTAVPLGITVGLVRASRSASTSC